MAVSAKMSEQLSELTGLLTSMAESTDAMNKALARAARGK